MPKSQRMSVQDIAEVLVSEMGEMKKTADKLHRAVEESKRVLPAIGHQLTRVEQTKLQVNTEPMQAILKRFETLSEENNRLPMGIVIWLVVASLGALAGTFFAFSYAGEVNELTEQIEKLETGISVYQEYLGDTEQQERFQKWIEVKREAVE